MNQHQKTRRRKFAAMLRIETPAKPRRRYIGNLPVAKLDPAETRRWFIPRDEMLT